MIDIEQDALCPLEQNSLAAFPLVIKQVPHRVGIGEDLRGNGFKICKHRSLADFCNAQPTPQGIVMSQQTVNFHTDG